VESFGKKISGAKFFQKMVICDRIFFFGTIFHKMAKIRQKKIIAPYTLGLTVTSHNLRTTCQ
jgi:hypothetical protein